MKTITPLIIVIAVFCAVFSTKQTNTESNLKIEDTTSIALPGKEEVSNTTFCSVCGREFTGRGYEEISEGIWRELEEGNQGLICSPSCGKRHSQNLNEVAKKYGVDLEKSETNSGSNEQYEMGSDGRVYEQNKCSLCKGTGIETGRNVATGEMEGRICPMCEGRGVRSY